MNLVIINYGSGNLRSVAKAFERASLDSGWHGRILVSDKAREVQDADYIVLPGVGAYGDCARGLQSVAGMQDALGRAVQEKQRPFLGICVGMQLMADRGLEHGLHKGLGWIAGEARLLAPSDPGLKIPHMGWNSLMLQAPGRAHPALQGMDAAECYFLHSYEFVARQSEDILALSDYGGPVVAVVGRKNMLGVQFHPEKSQASGLRLLANFLHWKP
ncbi:MAG: imidazole glycerol phosphate synthase subunit HisH [Pseudomonadota bacterium]